MINLNDSTLYISLRSPFARRARLALLFNDIKFQTEVMDIFKPPASYLNINPLVRIPSLKLKNGSVVVDSSSIVQAIYDSNPQSALIPKKESTKVENYYWSGIGVGLCELTVQFYLESLKPKEMQNPKNLEDHNELFVGALSQFDQFIRNRKYVGDEILAQGDLDMVSALDYMTVRIPNDWQKEFNNVTVYLSRTTQDPVFVSTKPPQA